VVNVNFEQVPFFDEKNSLVAFVGGAIFAVDRSKEF
jgi:hypothetical protein